MDTTKLSTCYRGRRVLVTGAGGYLGSELVRRLAELGATVTSIVRDASRAPSAASGRLVTVDLRREPVPEAILRESEVVFHLAAQTSGPGAAREPEADWELNVRPLLRMAVACRTGKRPRVVFASTVTVTDLATPHPVGEDAACRPVTVYDMHKLDGERYLEFFHREHGLETVTVRLSNVFGPSAGAGNADRGVVQKMAAAALRGGPLVIHGTGEWRRDYVFIDDAVDAFVRVGAAEAAAVAGKCFHACSGVGTAFRKAMEAVAEEAGARIGRRVEVKPDLTVALDAVARRDFVGDPRRLAEAVGWSARVPFREGVRKLVTRLAEEGGAS